MQSTEDTTTQTQTSTDTNIAQVVYPDVSNWTVITAADDSAYHAKALCTCDAVLPGCLPLHVGLVTCELCMQTAIMVPPGECFILTISSIPTTKSGTVSYTVPIMGGISVWFSDKTDIPGRESEGPHFNWNVPVGAILQYAVVSIEALNCIFRSFTLHCMS